MILDLHDWHFHTAGKRLIARPSLSSCLRQLWVTALCLVILVALLVLYLSKPWDTQRALQRKLATQQQRIERQQQEIQRLRSSSTFADAGSPSRQWHQQAQRDLQTMQQELTRLQASRASQSASSAQVFDGLLLAIMAFVGVIGVGLPGVAATARVVLEHEGSPGQGQLRVTQTFLLSQSAAIDLREVAALVVHGQRLATRHEHRLEAGGWLWRVQLMRQESAQIFHPLCTLLVDLNPTLPARMTTLPMRVRPVVEYLQAVTQREPLPVAVTDVIEETLTLSGYLRHLRTTTYNR